MLIKFGHLLIEIIKVNLHSLMCFVGEIGSDLKYLPQRCCFKYKVPFKKRKTKENIEEKQ